MITRADGQWQLPDDREKTGEFEPLRREDAEITGIHWTRQGTGTRRFREASGFPSSPLCVLGALAR